jgi:aspartyl-tRNA synthetase
MKKTYIKKLSDFVQKEVILQGWVDVRRDHGKLIFIDLRDVSGKVQMVALPSHEEAHNLANKVRPEWILEVKGLVNKRPEKMVKEGLNGDIEIEILDIKILNEAQTTPFEITEDSINVNEEVRTKYRYLDLRTERMKNNIINRARVIKYFRDYLFNENFNEIETPILTKSTPEGARDFLIPSRLQKGKFYALPQSPQQYKQMLMVAGFEKYFQIARCFRDEDPRFDRAYGEFTQLDIEMSFVEQEDILVLIENMFTSMVKEVFPEKKISQTPWPRLSHKEAVEKYGSDKPDLRKDKNDKDELAFTWVLDFPLFTEQSEEDFFHGSGKAKFAPSHHMFTAPHPDDVDLLDSEPTKVRGLQHDLVLNGLEVGGGSIRIHNPEIQTKIFDLIGFTEEQKKDFSHMLEAFSYGVPPHGGVAPGIDRLLLGILGEPSVRELIAFPNSKGGSTSVMNAPSEVASEQLKELGISIEKK